MSKKTVYQGSFLVSGIMCHQGCGVSIEATLKDLDDLKKAKILPDDAQLMIDAEPEALGIHRLHILIESDSSDFHLTHDYQQKLSEKLKAIVSDVGFDVVDSADVNQKDKYQRTNWINIAINLLAMMAIVALSVAFPPSIPLTAGLLTLSFLTTALTARSYLVNFYRNLRHKKLATMSTTITLGWLLSLGHSLYHAISMRMVTGFSMIFMSFMMPVMLITLINVMDEIKRLVLNQSKKMHLNSMKKLFPQMADEYLCYQVPEQHEEELVQLLEKGAQSTLPNEISLSIEQLLSHFTQEAHAKNTLKKKMFIKVKAYECFPVDGVIAQGNTLVDASILTGESQQYTRFLDFVPAGAINIGSEVTIYAREDCYNSTINRLLFRSNRAQAQKVSSSHPLLTYVYAGLIVLSLVASILTPFALGILTVPLALQNIMGILFAVCPCTMAIAHQLPNLLSHYQRNNQGIILRREHLVEPSEEVQTIVFDKTGTLTTGHSQVDLSEGISPSLWQRIYLLEKLYGAEHPLAKAIYHDYEKKGGRQSIINDVTEVSRDLKNRGISARVQGKPIHIGSSDFLERSGIKLPKTFSPSIQHKIEQGYTLVYVAEDNKYQGIILIKHEVRSDILESLRRLKKSGKKIIMLTGDSQLAATGFNEQNGAIFEPEDIYAEQTPQGKEDFLKQLMSDQTINPETVWFVGDGLNDAPCARIVSEKGGISFAMRSDDKASFFADISLNGSLSYLFEHNQLNRFLKKNITQNKGLLSYSALIFLAFIITFSVIGIAVSPLIPMVIMTLTTLFTVFNSYRSKLSVDSALDKNSSWLQHYLVSRGSIGLLVVASSLLTVGVLISTAATGGLALPSIVFTVGALAAATSVCVLTSGIMFGVFVVLGLSYLVINHYRNSQKNTAEGTEDRVINELEPTVSLTAQDEVLVSKDLNFGVSQRVKKSYSTLELFSDHDHASINTNAL